MKKLLVAAFACFALASAPALADTNLGVVNIARVLRDSKAAVSVRNQIQAKEKSLQTEFDSKKKDLDADQQNLVKEKNSVDKGAFEAKLKDFNAKANTAQHQVRDKSVALEKAIAGSQEQIVKTAADIVKDIAAERKLTLVVASTQVVYGDPSLDLTDEVIKRLDAKLPSLAVQFQ